MSSWIPSLFNPSKDEDNPRSPSSGVKEDLSTVFRGVAAFLAPQPSSSSSSTSSSDAILGLKSDLAEIQGSFRSGLSLISSKFTSNFLPFNEEENDEDEDGDEVSDEEDVVGINDEVVGFIRKISGRHELWTDFPISLPDDYNLSDYQRDHAASIDHLVPELLTLRQKSCSHISNEKFWLIYFILLFPRLNDEDMELLSTPEVVEARETLLKKLQKKTDSAHETSENSETSHTDECRGQETSQRTDVSVQTINSSKQRDSVNEIESGHDSEEVATYTVATRQSENSEFSFSDLEDEETHLPGAGSDKTSRGEWIQQNESSGAEVTKRKGGKSAALRDKESEGEDSNDWLTVDDTDFDNLAEI